MTLQPGNIAEVISSGLVVQIISADEQEASCRYIHRAVAMRKPLNDLRFLGDSQHVMAIDPDYKALITERNEQMVKDTIVWHSKKKAKKGGSRKQSKKALFDEILAIEDGDELLALLKQKGLVD